MKVLVCGSRSWKNSYVVHELLNELEPTHVIEGGAVGADRMAFEWAADNAVPVTTCTPNWAKYGRRAGFVRNIQMLDLGPDLVVAFWDSQSKGTKHTIDEARKRGIEVKVVLEGRADSAD